MVNIEKIRGALLNSILFIIVSCNSQPKPAAEIKEAENKDIKYKVTFIELGSVGCIPCARMRVVMKSIEEKFGSQVRIVFHDVWTEDGAPYAKEFGITVIPTQVFLDSKGKEYFRHEGYFEEEDVITVLKKKGVK